MVKDYTIMIVAIAFCVTALMITALLQGKNGILVDSYLLFMGGLIGAITTHYKNKTEIKKLQAQIPGGD